METPDIIFPNIGIEFGNINNVAFTIFGLEIYWYALFICTGIIGGWLMATYLAKKTKQDPDIYAEFLIWAMVSAIVGARLYYVVFSWDDYKNDLGAIFNLRQGGLAIYGGVILSVIALIVFTKRKKLNFWVLADTASVGIFVGQIVGRLGNFVNREAYGGYSDGFFAMAIKRSEAKGVPVELLDKLVDIGGTDYIQVHPMFLYEIMWNIVALAFVLWYFKRRRFNGEVFALYFVCYGLGRAWMETMRTDQLILGDTGIPVSVITSILLATAGLVFIVIKRIEAKRLALPYPQAIIDEMPDEKADSDEEEMDRESNESDLEEETSDEDDFKHEE